MILKYSSNRFSNRILNIEGSKASFIAEQAMKLKKNSKKPLISLAIGEPGFNTNKKIKEAAKKAIDKNYTNYTPIDGIEHLKDAIINRYKRDYNLYFLKKEICITTGAKHALHNLLNCILNPGDEVIFFSPFWTSYPEMIKMAYGLPVCIKTSYKNSFQPEKDMIISKINSKTRIILLNIPNNPTGVFYYEKTLKMLAKLLNEYPNIWIINDDIYDLLCWNKNNKLLIEINPNLKNRYVIINGVSKSYSMAGWRIGYIIGPKDIIHMIKIYQSQSITCACSISQYAAIEALNLSRTELFTYMKIYKKRVLFCYYSLLKIRHIKCLVPHSTFYLFPYIETIIKNMGFKNDQDFCLELLKTQSLAIMPGSAFGAPGYLRLTCSTTIHILYEAMKRLYNFINNK